MVSQERVEPLQAPQIATSVKPELRVGFVLMNQFTLVPVAGLVDSLRFAADKSFRSQQVYCQWDWMTLDDQPISASCGMPVSPTKPLNLWAQYDYIVLAGGLLGETRNPPAWLLEALRDLHAANVPIIALCSGSFVLGKAGLLDGRRCAVHFTLRDEFKERFPLATMVIDKSYVDDRGIITCPGGTAIDLAASLIRRHCGAVRAQKGLEYLLVDERAEEAREEAASVYQNDRVQRAIAFMRANLDASMTLKAVAEAVGTHPRQLHREFVANTQEPPANYWRKLRLDHARRLLVNTSQNITTIALACGFSDASHFILWFRKQYGETPYSFRKRRHEVERFDWHGDKVGLDPEL
ncbi:GlxA family transcriptional regulator [Pseudomonas guariconensis]|uniref:GlxA family transcriptional regulator n=1 Tax=Pseudomonas TaxID=286 RepID=UPI001CE484F7|nr:MULTISPECIES: GlxA family transcriptional regulator [Pseudomonas]MCO7638616.1 GlxA family transcriptional regulator [Pseudomonas sp. S 311-6]MCO7513875.1 GlxA family transcriptional regulator [Pseudomonas putida]MCO7565918.1 GlxA family transcriptional regulator [Pseudomonas mosselii]MCO7595575.1 GlxA family transcriptional regulator [Pseudomonas guariconensis]MCO7605322.1 GlxA family transcriptional regulator [Pseudomonas guariconensis]